jgi:bacterioferritin-associated ferredoxin
MLVCHCAVVSDRTIRATIAAGADDVDAVGQGCRAGVACGGCRPAIEDLLAEAALAIREPALVGDLQAARRHAHVAATSTRRPDVDVRVAVA